jgi:hypothetical protein
LRLFRIRINELCLGSTRCSGMCRYHYQLIPIPHAREPFCFHFFLVLLH